MAEERPVIDEMIGVERILITSLGDQLRCYRVPVSARERTDAQDVHRPLRSRRFAGVRHTGVVAMRESTPR